MQNQKPSVIRGTINGKAMYCRIPVRSKLFELMQESGDLSAETILAMPHEKAVAVIDAIMHDWLFWMPRAGEYFVQLTPEPADKEGEG